MDDKAKGREKRSDGSVPPSSDQEAATRGQWYWLEEDESKANAKGAKHPHKTGPKDTYTPGAKQKKQADCSGTSSGSDSDGCSRSHVKDWSDDCSDPCSDPCSDSSSDCSDTCTDKVHPCRSCGQEDLLKAIALEELALAHVINAEAEKAQAVANAPMTPFTPDELIAFQQSVAKVLEMVVAKEALLLKKLRLLLALCPPPCTKCRKAKRCKDGDGHHPFRPRHLGRCNPHPHAPID